MSEIQGAEPNGVSRRNVTKAMAWAVPAIAVAATVPYASASEPPPPPPPSFNFGNACATVGNSNDGCANLSKTPQVPFSLTNPAGNGQLVFQITAMNFVNGNDVTLPQTNAAGVAGIWAQNINGSANEYSGLCPTANAAAIAPTLLCPNLANPSANILVADGATLNLWIVAGNGGQSASDFTSYIAYRWVDPSDSCAVVANPADPGFVVKYANPSGNCQ